MASTSLKTDNETCAFAARPTPSDCVVAMDAPLIVPNEAGQRPSELLIMDPVVAPGTGRRVCIEVYPHLAMVALFDLEYRIPYKDKAGRDLEDLKAAWLWATEGLAACQVLGDFSTGYIITPRLRDGTAH